MKSPMVSVSILTTLALSAIALNGCAASSSSSQEDTSASGLAAGAAGGALSDSNSNGTLAYLNMPGVPSTFLARAATAFNPFPSAEASISCPTFKTTGSGCEASGGDLWLTYDDCSFGGPASWNGVKLLQPSSANGSCGTFPNPGADGNLVRQAVTASDELTPGSLSVTTKSGVTATIDDADMTNFNGTTIATIANSGYGTQVDFGANGARTSITIAHHITSPGLFDMVIAGTLPITENPGASTRTIGGALTIYHNLLQIIGTSTFNDVTHDDTCCLPVSGSITTLYSEGNVAPKDPSLVGESETLTFTGCGTATFTNVKGQTSNVTLDRCF